MTKLIALLVLLVAAPFWETAPVTDWDEQQLLDFFANSPWAQPAESTGAAGVRDGVTTFLATALPVQLAEKEMRRRRIKKVAGVETIVDPAWDEYQEFLERDAGKYIVLAVAVPTSSTQAANDMALMENQSFLRVGKQKIKMSGYFPPSPTDPYTRFIFPKGAAAEAKELTFELFIPGTGTPYRMAVYPRKGMTYRGRLEM
ncbi:hypothetical protein [Bryobacter aggregatus]|uniref:hypothetical protein n=1 Tax=Bryobacter aggregatus TaxID=360054 RepID=UPI0004E104A7|nr:hypothetical protein [Bryobacter aggregatus]